MRTKYRVTFEIEADCPINDLRVMIREDLMAFGSRKVMCVAEKKIHVVRVNTPTRTERPNRLVESVKEGA